MRGLLVAVLRRCGVLPAEFTVPTEEEIEAIILRYYPLEGNCPAATTIEENPCSS